MGRNTILLVEDDFDVGESIAGALEDYGFIVDTAADGRLALAYLRRTAELPALILLDLMMPVMDGWTFRAEQLRDPAIAGVPVVVLSALGEGQPQLAALQVAATLDKPLGLCELLLVVRRYCTVDDGATPAAP